MKVLLRRYLHWWYHEVHLQRFTRRGLRRDVVLAGAVLLSGYLFTQLVLKR